MIVLLNGLVWTTGVRDYDLADAVEKGAARVEERQVGEESEDVIRKAIKLQRDTLTFWTVILAIRDFLIDPLWIALRALSVAVGMSAVAAMSGRPVRFPATLARCVAWQGVWVFGLAVQVVLMLALGRSHVETSLLMLFPEGTYTARQYLMLQQIDGFAVIGWFGMTWGAYRCGQASALMAVLVSGTLVMVETSLFSSAALVVNLAMRSTLMP